MTDRTGIVGTDPSDLAALATSVLSRDFGIEAATVDYQQGGQDDGSTVFRVTAATIIRLHSTPTHILKIDHGRPGGVIAPDITRSSNRWCSPGRGADSNGAGATTVAAGQLTFALYPFIDGTPGT